MNDSSNLIGLLFCIDLSLSRAGREFTFTKLGKLIDFTVCKIKQMWRRAGFALQMKVTKITKLTRAKYKLNPFRWPEMGFLQMRKSRTFGLNSKWHVIPHRHSVTWLIFTTY